MPPGRRKDRRDLAVTLGTLLLVLAWDASGLDLPLTRTLATSRGFPWRDTWLTDQLLHEGGRLLAAGAMLALLLHALWPRGLGWQDGTGRHQRWAALGGVLLNLTAVPALKRASATSCPWDLAEFGGSAPYVPHWDWGVPDLGPGHCFPSGHAVAGFAFIALYLAWRDTHPARARRWLWFSMATGLAFGGSQVLRGAHYLSHVAWSGWLCWSLAMLVFAMARRRQPARVSDAAAASGHRECKIR
ncbi:MAG: phosphatase PAP2 family protein [Hylemonella sp.]|uniref:phosphatase PAP2 family protein n=1 Tax=Hylemonella sp. TaxID=2066020 RepID=UPI00391DC09E